MDCVQRGRVAALLGIVAASCSPSFALNPTLNVSQYGHKAWTVSDGFLKGGINAIVQSTGGYLLLGTEFGLSQFDGVRNEPWPLAPDQLPSNNIRSLLAARDGTLWIGTIRGLGSWKNGKLTLYPEVPGQNIYTLLEDRDGTVWAGTFGVPTARLCGIRAGTVKCYGEDGSFGQWVESLYEDSGGRLWAGAGTGLWQWKPGPPKRYRTPDLIEGSQTILEDFDKSALIVIGGSMWRMADGKAEPYRLQGVRWPFLPLNMLRDRDGGLWIGTLDHGLLHSYGGRTDAFSQSDGLSDNHVRCFFEDREGNVWVATSGGLDRFRGMAVTSYSVKQGLSSLSTMTVLAARDGAVWTSTEDGLNRWKDGEVSIYRASAAPPAAAVPDCGGIQRGVHEVLDRGLPENRMGALFEDDRGRIWVSGYHGISRFENGRFRHLEAPPGGWVNGIVGDGAGGVWIAYQDLGLYHLIKDRVVEQFPWDKLGHGAASSLTPDPRNQGLWLGFFDGGLVNLQAGAVRASYGRKEGLGAGRVMDIQLDAGGVVWAATEGGLSRIQNGAVLTLTMANGLPCDGVHWTVEDDGHWFWLYTSCGLLRIPREELDAWASHPDRSVQPAVLDAADGVQLRALLTGYMPRVSRAPDGRIWFAHVDSISVVDPRHLPANKLLAPVHIEEVLADRKVHWRSSPGDAAHPRIPALPPKTRDLEIDYTALSLGAPDKVHFRYKLEGYEDGWQTAGNHRQAFYANLPPRTYRFRVIASNDSGVWNEAGDTLEFSIAPAFYQKNLFRLGCAAVLLFLVWVLYQLRVRQIAGEFQARIEERTRIARELHDTLLQSFQGLMFSFQAARNLLPSRTEEAILTLDGAIREGDEAIAEGRNAIQGLRANAALDTNLERQLTVAGAELTRSSNMDGEPAGFRVSVEGAKQPLSPVLQDDVYRIAREILRNAFHHAHASRIEADIVYDPQFFRLRIRDNGKGISREVLMEGARPGHWGLQGVRERAKRIGAQFNLWSEPGAGTEAELTIPGRIAYRAGNRREVARLFRRAKGSG